MAGANDGRELAQAAVVETVRGNIGHGGLSRRSRGCIQREGLPAFCTMWYTPTQSDP